VDTDDLAPLIMNAQEAACAMDDVLNIGFFAFHSSWILFNCVVGSGALVATCDGVANRAVLVRSGHLVRMGLLSMHGLALAGSARLGHQDPPSYIQLMIRELFGIDLGPNRANALALGTLTAAAVISILLNVRDRRRSNQLRA
jgi:hypothetical protein